jgi:hypothetical protein
VYCYRDPVYPAYMPLISKVLQYPSMLPTPIVYYIPCHCCVILDTTKKDINKKIGEAFN